MRVGLGQFMDPAEERLRFIKHLGVDDVLLNVYQYDDPDYEHMPDDERTPISGDGEWSAENLRALRERVRDADLRLEAIENVPVSFYEDVMPNGPKRGEQVEKLKRTIRNMGEAGIPSSATTGRPRECGGRARRRCAAGCACRRSTPTQPTGRSPAGPSTRRRNCGTATSTSCARHCRSPRRPA